MPEFKIVQLITPGFSTTVDMQDFERLFKPDDRDEPTVRWYGRTGRSGVRYAMRKGLLLHRLIMQAPPGVDVDHRDADGLNNRRENLRLATKSQNGANQRVRGVGLSRYKGVSISRGLWTAGVWFQGKNYACGTFATELAAARAYNETAKAFFGEFARLNELPEE